MPTSSSTTAQWQAEYDDTASYAEATSVANLALCRRFITACRVLIRRTPTVAQKGANAVHLDAALLQKELERAQTWLEARSTADDVGPGVTRPDFRRFRNPGAG